MNSALRGPEIRLRIVRDCLAPLGEVNTPSTDLQREVRRYSMVGGGRLREVLAGLDISPRVRDEQATALALITNMVDSRQCID
jgi:multidrug resistance protein MdtO